MGRTKKQHWFTKEEEKRLIRLLKTELKRARFSHVTQIAVKLNEKTGYDIKRCLATIYTEFGSVEEIKSYLKIAKKI